MSSNLVF